MASNLSIDYSLQDWKLDPGKMLTSKVIGINKFANAFVRCDSNLTVRAIKSFKIFCFAQMRLYGDYWSYLFITKVVSIIKRMMVLQRARKLIELDKAASPIRLWGRLWNASRAARLWILGGYLLKREIWDVFETRANLKPLKCKKSNECKIAFNYSISESKQF